MGKCISFFLLMFMFFNQGISQNPQLKSGVVFKKLFLDYQSQNGGSFSEFKEYRHGYEIGYHRMLSDKIAINFPLRYGVVNSHLDSINCLKKRVASLDAQFQYQFNEPGRKIIPYVLAGVGGVMEQEGDFNIQIPAGLGFYFRLAPNAYVTLQSEFRYSLAESRNNLQHGVGFTYLFGKAPEETPKQMEKVMEDNDNDGIANELDLCPNAFGRKELNGCPDKDGDGVADYLDKCPDTKGLAAFGGCPDTDMDGISDNEDECPNIAGIKALKGCPEKVVDTDGDGVPDADDKCPGEKGTSATMGCPDADGDGVVDKDDKCPNKPGLKIYYGCPDTDGDGIGDVCDPDPTDPDVGVLIRKWGEFKKDNFGISVANAGDVNHDNIDDVVVGAYLWDKPILGRKKKLRSIGRVYVYSGRDGSELFSSTPLVGENRRDWFGYSVAGADINGDGYSDIIVGAPHWDVPKVGAQKALRNAGKVYVFNGQTGMLMASVQGTAADDNLGWSVSNAGDTDQDGSPDVVIGAPKADTTVSGKRQNNAGRALVCSGVVLAAAVDPNANACDVNTALFSVEGEVAGNGLGRTVAGAGDVDGDGHTDIVLGLPKADVSGKKNAGLAAVYSGATGAEWARAEGENAGDWFGYSVAGAGDLNGDSKADIVVGAYRYTATSITGKRMKQAGAVYRFTCVSAGTCSSIGQKTEGEAARDRLGWSVAAGGDVNNDGQLGVVAGAPGRDVTLPPVPPKTRGKRLKNVGAVYLLDGATGVSIHTPVLGVRAKDARGTCLASGGDVNGDGYSDIITAASKADTQKWIPNRNPTKPPKLKTIKNVGFVEVISGRTASGH